MLIGKNWIVEAFATEGQFRSILITPKFDDGDYSHKPIHYSRMQDLELATFGLVEAMLPNYDEGRMWLSKDMIERAMQKSTR
jgi:hypothetical protein